jgi:hypothetical protein
LVLHQADGDLLPGTGFVVVMAVPGTASAVESEVQAAGTFIAQVRSGSRRLTTRAAVDRDGVGHGVSTFGLAKQTVMRFAAVPAGVRKRAGGGKYLIE